MSRIIAALVYSKRIGSVHRKAVLAYMADRASDDGSGVWASKQTIANETECARSTVIKSCNEFIEEGLLIQTGTRKCPHGLTIEYCINVEKLEMLPSTKDKRDPSGGRTSINPDGFETTSENALPDPTRPANGSQDVAGPDTNRPITVLEPSKIKTLQKEIPNPSAEFEIIWPVYRKIRGAGKASALKSWLKARKKNSYEAIAAPLRDYIRANQGKDQQFILHLSTWLNQERFLDETQTSNGTQNSDEAMADLLHGDPDLNIMNTDDDMARLFAKEPKQIGMAV